MSRLRFSSTPDSITYTITEADQAHMLPPTSFTYNSSKFTTTSYHRFSPSTSLPNSRPRMSLTQTYMLAHTARSKLSKEASRGDHNLHRLVGHANMLDNLMIDLANAEQEQESWFNQTVSGVETSHTSSISPSQSVLPIAVHKEVLPMGQWDIDTAEENEAVSTAIELDYSSSSEEESDDGIEVDEEYEEGLALTRTISSKNIAHPHDHDITLPELISHHSSESDTDSDSDDEFLPHAPSLGTSLPSDSDLFSHNDKRKAAIVTTSFYSSPTTLPIRTARARHATAIAAYG